MKDKLKAHLNKMNLYMKLCIIFIFIFLTAIFLITITSGIISHKLAKNEVVENSRLLLDELKNNIEYIFTDAENISRFIIYDDRVQEFLLADKRAEYKEKMEAAQEVLIGSLLYKNYLESILVFDMDGNVINRGSSPSYVIENAMKKNSPWLTEAISKEGMYTWSYVTSGEGVNSRSSIILTRVINAKNSRKPVGFLMIFLKNEYMNEIVGALNKGYMGNFFVYNDKGELILPSDEGEYRTVMEASHSSVSQSQNFLNDYGNYYILQGPGNHIGWKIYCVIGKSKVYVEYITNLCIILSVCVVCIFLGIMIYVRVTRGITGSIDNLIISMNNAEKEEFKKELEQTRFDEIGFLTEAYNKFIRRINVLVNEVYEEKLRTREAELASLQAQINPHFLYNTLNCINWKALEQKQYDISKMVLSLSKMFRFSLGGGEKEVTLQQEMDSVRDYLFLQQCRLEERLKIFIEIPESILDVKILKFTIQPIVENSILYGVSNSEEGRIWINAFELEGSTEAENAVVIEVVDNGSGANLEKVESILCGKGKNGNEHGNGIRNVNERLKLSFGPEYGLSFSLPATGGTKVSIRIPARRN